MQSYSISSTDHFSNQQKTYYDIRAHNELFDVTLACGDVTIQSHKLLLASSSQYFREIFKQIEQPNPFIFLKGIEADDLQAMIDFIYTGETKVEATNIKRFLEFATELKIYGIMCEDIAFQNEDEEETIEVPTKDVVKDKLRNKLNKSKKQKTVPPTEVKIEFNETNKTKHLLDAITSSNAVFDEMILTGGNSHPQSRNAIASKKESNMKMGRSLEPDISDNGQFSSSSDMNILDSEIRKRVIIEQNELGKKVYTCRECGKSFLRKDKIDLHVEIHIGGFTHSCELCGTVTKSRKALMNHKYFNHTKKNNLENK